MKEIVSTVSRDGRVTIPAEVRRLLGLEMPGRVAFAVGDEGVWPRSPRTNVDALFGTIPALPHESADLEAEIEEAMQARADQSFDADSVR